MRKEKNSTVKHFFAKFAVVWLVSIFLFALYFYLKNYSSLAPRIRFPTMYNLGLFILMPLMLFLHSRKKIKNMHLNRIKGNAKDSVLLGLASLFCFAVFFFIMFFGNVYVMMAKELFFAIILELIYLFGYVFLFLACYGMKFFKEFYRESVLIFFVLFDFMLITMLLASTWHVFSTTLVKLVYFVFRIFTNNANVFFVGLTPNLTLKNFSVAVGASCSGIESLSMFLFVAIFVFLLDWNRINFRRAWVLVPGLIGMFFVSVIRIAVLMWVGTFDPALSLGLFHTNTGWILFVVYLMVFWYFYYPWLTKESKSAKIIKKKKN